MHRHTIKAQAAEVRARKVHSVRLAAIALCAAMAACGGGGGDDAPAGLSGATADPASSPASPRATVQGSASPAIEAGIRPDVLAYLAPRVFIDDERRAIAYLAARSMQATLTVPLRRGPELQAVVNDLYRAQVCLKTLLKSEGESLWVAIENWTFNSLQKRMRYWQFSTARQLLARSPDAVACGSLPRGSGEAPAQPPASAPSPTDGQMLKDEFARLEVRGDLPVLDRSSDVRGPDLNGNGVRDDIDKFIAAQTLDDAQRRAMLQVARSIQTTLFVRLDDSAAVQAVSEANTAADACLLRVFRRSADQRGGEYLLKLEAITANTPERAKRYMQYMTALSGTSVELPRGDSCQP